ncbi:GTP 3',8-cyclase MoaA [Sediminicola luteus]|uniref:GTP 3',8-cyclase n=1 Tax=Sediminicola luteus TaxID=319238 RepID=A0A2A4GBJ3_9FLAO|nr:GTP 3',8-cyclase MoaA [Sediminicola luteus]PCE65823.1 GTP 3',8-cyclase MoaA [Sediminicola luteus]
MLTDNFGRFHNYLRISLTERCNLRCTYCMPLDGIPLSPKSHLMTYEEIYDIAKTFVDQGVNKIRLTGGEPLVRKDVVTIIEKLATLPVNLCMTTNGVIVDRFIEVFKANGLRQLNISLDSLQAGKNKDITRRDYFQKVYDNILLLAREGFEVKVNVVLIQGFNDNEIADFIRLGKDLPLHIRFIEFMPFDGNRWNMDKLVSYQQVLSEVNKNFPIDQVIRLNDAPNDTAKNYMIQGYRGSFAIISSVTNPFCDSCNRIRLTANGRIKNCLFSSGETDILSPFRQGEDIKPLIQQALGSKKKVRAGMERLEDFKKQGDATDNRSMIAIGG